MPRTAKSKPHFNSLPISPFYFIYCVFIYVLNQENVSKFNHVQNFWDKKGRENGGDTGQEKYPSHWSLVESSDQLTLKSEFTFIKVFLPSLRYTFNLLGVSLHLQ